jgi:hypothetical protein
MNDNEKSGALTPGGAMSEGELLALRRASLEGLRRSILMQLRAGAAHCREQEGSAYQAREQFAHLCQVARNVDRLATAGVILLRDPFR